MLIWVPLYDMVIAPFFARRGRPISLLVRIGIGYLVAMLAMIAAAGGCALLLCARMRVRVAGARPKTTSFQTLPQWLRSSA